LGSEASRIQKEDQRKIDDDQPLTEEECIEKEKLLTALTIPLRESQNFFLKLFLFL
jgi:hypothetical protein